MKLADKIILLRKRKGWSQEELAAQVNVSRQSVSKWELGESVPDIDKILMLSQVFDVSTDYLLKETEETIETAETENAESTHAYYNPDNINDVKVERQEPKRYVSRTEAMGYLDVCKGASKKIAIAVWLFICSPAALITLVGFSESKMFGFTEQIAVAIGMATLLIMVTVGVALCIISGISISKYEYIQKEVFLIDRDVENEIRELNNQFMSKFAVYIAVGVMLCILSVIPVVTFGVLKYELMTMIATSILLIVVACGVFLFIRVGVVKGSMSQLLQEGEYTKERKAAEKKLDPIASVYWMIITIAYLSISFLTMEWHRTWIIWPIAGITFGIIAVIVQNTSGKKNKD